MHKVEDADATLRLRNISKTFGGTRALKSVNLTIRPGEIHGLLGQNGCGKSTLIKVLAGYHQPDPGGELWVSGVQAKLPLQPGESSKYGISFVHQDLGLIPEFTVLENLLISKLAVSKALYIDWKEERRNARETLRKYKVNMDIDMEVSQLGPVEKAMLAIVRAVEDIKGNKNAKEAKRGLLILDEPTVFLPKEEVDTLFRLVREIVAEGYSVLFVSHEIDEVLELTDMFTVLRDGMNVGSAETKHHSKHSIIEMILGEKLNVYEMESKSVAARSKAETYRFDKLQGDLVRSVSFQVSKGEVLGITGLVGSGFEEIPYILFGVLDEQSGAVSYQGKHIDLSSFSPRQAVENKMALIPADRPNAGGIGDLLTEDNLMMLVMKDYRPFRLQKKKMLKKANELLSQYKVHPHDPKMVFSQLSGGNQQKVILAKWLQDAPELLILHEPTQGVDIGARQQLYTHIDNASVSGMAVICSSSDYEQLEQLCTRVLVFSDGQIVSELTGSEITKERIMQCCYNIPNSELDHKQAINY
ncbi:sugar ABC transporter ATP-binding protein [Paenibacillus xylaniclasticus]|uniref:sugar ABC transporter ATP-binding protein n=1 Tax=Paenibacillus xylaniclasticus TaxID=588083 RepID=UPI000FDCCF4A|nr:MULTISPECIES: sugar ABC transporter ATP-binding protein [Paenibacillus]GFN33161.1 ribose import ATP-binding protein RbsA [Paenibacillus curdlanolyticus]